MAISETIRLNDQMSAQLLKITGAMDTVIASIEKTKGISNTALSSARGDLRAVNAELVSTKDRTAALGTPMQQATKHSNSLTASIKSMVGMVGGLYAVQKAFSLISNSIDSAMNRTQQETKLMTIMKERMGTSNIKSATNVMKSQSNTGVIGTTTQMQGAQQVSTFLNQKKSLETLIPAMNNLAVQQHGVNTTGEDMKNIGNMVGKVMQGQTGALRRVGITFTSAQEKALKYGSETKRAATLATVITNNVGNMNKEIAKTPQGQMTQLKNKMNGVKLSIGQGIVPALANLNKILGNKENLKVIQNLGAIFGNVTSGIITGLAGVASVASRVFGFFGKITGAGKNMKNVSGTVAKITEALVALSIVMLTVKTAQAAMNVVNAISIARSTLKTGATLAEAAATTTATGAQVGLNAAMLANPITWIIVGIAALVVAIVVLQKKTQIFTKIFSAVGSKIKSIIDGIKSKFSSFIAFIKGPFAKGWATAWHGVVNVFSTIWSGIKTVAKAPINAIISMVNFLIRGVDKFSIKMPKWAPKVGGKTFGINIPQIPALATGTKNFGGGLALVGENGPELTELPHGTRVNTNSETRKMVGSTKTITISKLADSIVVREDADIDKIASRVADEIEAREDDVA